MKSLIVAGLAAGAALLAISPAEARQGCGPGYHRGPAGHCRPNMRPGRPALVVGHYYHGQGYWDGNRYWRHRYRDHGRGDWRYR